VNEQPYILVVDDDPDILEGIQAVLENEPYSSGIAPTAGRRWNRGSRRPGPIGRFGCGSSM
jgi:CheY-like chemotaxis protein